MSRKRPLSTAPSLELSSASSLEDSILTLNAAICAHLRCRSSSTFSSALEALSAAPSVFDTAPWLDPLGLRCERPPLDACVRSFAKRPGLLAATADILSRPDAAWKEPKDLSDSYSDWASGSLRSVMLVGKKKYGATLIHDRCYAGIFWLAPNTRYPCHAHEAEEALIVLSGGDCAVWQVDGILARGTAIEDGGVIHVPPGRPHSVRSGAEALLVYYVWTGSLHGRYWFCTHAPAHAYQDLKSASLTDPELYYDAMAGEYASVVRRWGYDAPERVSKKLLELTANDVHLTSLAGQQLSLLDCGCGDGLFGEALVNTAQQSAVALTLAAGTATADDARVTPSLLSCDGDSSCWCLTGIDCSSKMLQLAAAKSRRAKRPVESVATESVGAEGGSNARVVDGCVATSVGGNRDERIYKFLVKADLTKRLDMFADGSFDALVCIGTTTYLDPSVLDDWIRVVKVGGLIGFTHKSAVWPRWEARQAELVQASRWVAVSRSQPLAYLPGYDENARLNERVKIYFYRVA